MAANWNGVRSQWLRPAPALTLVVSLLAIWGCTTSDLASSQPEPQPIPDPRGQMLPIEGRAIVGDRIFDLEIARTPAQQQLGLMFRDPLPEGQGMLFPFEPPRPVSFWMFNVTFDLDIVFMFEGEVVYIAASVPGCAALPCPSYGPPEDVLADSVLELNGGTAAQIELKPGTAVAVEYFDEP
ncbi:DUF192 domain-containing protein [Synechococcus sp. PCC 7336]|uniref:DUF192 domain-containing protein n=1 Tax=Synechococcus sp. PCC 7336 TaxID=195250 RepID=UPI00034C7CB6|nr:DUF192 domain-containing protein [Synechococcus sp. PCC 7336]